MSGEEGAQPVERLGRETVVREGAAALSLQQADVGELLQVVADRRLREAELRLELADAARLSGAEERADDPDAGPIGERGEERFQLGGLLVREVGGERGAAGKDGQSLHALQYIESHRYSLDRTL